MCRWSSGVSALNVIPPAFPTTESSRELLPEIVELPAISVSMFKVICPAEVTAARIGRAGDPPSSSVASPGRARVQRLSMGSSVTLFLFSLSQRCSGLTLAHLHLRQYS